MNDESLGRENIRDKARTLVAKLAEQFAKNVIAPHKKPLAEHTLVIKTVWEADSEQTISDAIARCKKRAASKRDGRLSKLFFGALRFMGFGYIEPTGQGDVEYSKADGENHYTITTTLGVRIEEGDSLAAMSSAFSGKLRALPRGLVCSMTGVPAKRARLIDLVVEVL